MVRISFLIPSSPKNFKTSGLGFVTGGLVPTNPWVIVNCILLTFLKYSIEFANCDYMIQYIWFKKKSLQMLKCRI